MSRQLLLIVLFNALICLLYVFFHVYLSTNFGYVQMEAFYLVGHGTYTGFMAIYPNFFTLFFIASIAVNLYFIVKLGRGREAKQMDLDADPRRDCLG